MNIFLSVDFNIGSHVLIVSKVNTCGSMHRFICINVSFGIGIKGGVRDIVFGVTSNVESSGIFVTCSDGVGEVTLVVEGKGGVEVSLFVVFVGLGFGVEGVWVGGFGEVKVGVEGGVVGERKVTGESIGVVLELESSSFVVSGGGEEGGEVELLVFWSHADPGFDGLFVDFESTTGVFDVFVFGFEGSCGFIVGSVGLGVEGYGIGRAHV